MARKQVTGECRLCGIVKNLTFEHVPPEAAFNSHPRFHPSTREMIEARCRGGPSPSIVEEPRGSGAYTLCGECNTKRGARYAREFIDWAVFWQGVLDTEPSAGVITAASRIRPSRIMKQLTLMGLCSSPPKTGSINDGVRRFIYTAPATGLPPDIRVFVALTRDKDARQGGGVGKVNTETGIASIFSEVAFAPFISVMTLGGTPPPDPRLVDITRFAQANYDEQSTTRLTLPVLRLQDIYPGSYH
jgi:hypothetical protein